MQSTVLTRLTVLGVVPQLLFVAVISLAFVEGEVVGVVVGFCAGVLLDLLVPQSLLGITAFVYTLLGYAAGTIGRDAHRGAPWGPVAVVAVASLLAETCYAAIAVVVGQRWISFADTAAIAALVVLYNTLLTPFVFPLVRRISERTRSDQVVRI